MSQSSFSFHPSAAAKAPVPGPTGVVDDIAAPDRRPLLVAAAAAVVLAIATYLLFFAGGGEPAAVAVAPPVPVADAATPTPDALAAAPELQATTTDPFKPLVSGDPGAAGIAGSAGSTPSTYVPVEQVPVPGPTPGLSVPVVPLAPVGPAFPVAPVAPVAPVGPVGPGVAPAAHSTVTALEVATDNRTAVLTVDGKEFTVASGAAFADGFTLLRLERGVCATVRHGSDAFDLCEGQSHRVA